MKSTLALGQLLIVLFSCITLLSGCDAITGIFEAGMWVGIFIVAGIIGLIIFIITKMGRKR